jgi:predicted component of viral defense system (DUF524 family)
MLRIASKAGQVPVPQDGRLRLEAEVPWVITASDAADQAMIAAVESALPTRAVERVAGALVVRFTNEVGLYSVPGLSAPVLEVVSGKWSDADYEAMLGEICARIAALPFTAGTGAQLPYDRSLAADPRVLYHAYVYLRHILSESAPREERLLPVLRSLLRDPHRRFDRTRRECELHRCRRVDARTVRRVPTSKLQRVERPTSARLLSEALGGHLPVTVDEPTVRQTFDVPENRFVKAFIGQCIGIIETIAAEAERVGGAFAARTQGESQQMLRALRLVQQASLWTEVGPMTRLPGESTILQRRQGYREVFRHFLRLRMTTRIPFDQDDRDLLEVKDIASLYEIWCFFAVEKAVSAVLGRPIDADSATTSMLQRTLGYDLRVTWRDGTALAYNLRFSRSRPEARRSYSVPLRPDITLRLPSGRTHLFDAKFRLRKLGDAGGGDADDDEVTDKADERRGDYKRADIYKMHTYRDALGSATAWVLYPGDLFQFFVDEPGAAALTSPEQLDPLREGVGGVPLVPGTSATALDVAVVRLLAATPS